MSRYEFYLTKSDKIYWFKNSVDKPSKDMFNQILNSVDWEKQGNINPNWENQFNGTITVKDDDYTYGKLIDTKKNTIRYYCIDGINKELNEGYVINITLDVFSTYAYDVFDYVKLNNKPLNINRTSLYRYFADSLSLMKQIDDLLPPFNAPLTLGIFDKYKTGNIYKLSDNNVHQNVVKITANDTPHKWDIANVSTDWNITFNTTILENMYFDVFLKDEYYYFILRDNSSIQQFAGHIHTQSGVWGNKRTMDEYVKKSNHFGSFFIGTFFIPFIYAWGLAMDDLGILEFQKFIPSGSGGGGHTEKVWFIMGRVLPSNLLKPIEKDLLNQRYFINPSELTNIYKIGLNKTYKPLYILQKMKQYNNESNWIKVYNDMSYFINFNETLKINFNEYTGLTYITNDFNTIECGETKPTSKNNYLEYLRTTQSSRNANLKGMGNNISMGLFNLGVSSLTQASPFLLSRGLGLNPFFAAMNVNAGLIQFVNFTKQQQAELKDRKRYMMDKIYSSTNELSNMIHGIILTKQNKHTQWVNSFVLNGYDLNDDLMWKNVNNILWNNGLLVNLETNINNINFYNDDINDFIFWDLTISKDIIKQHKTTLNNELIDAIEIIINQPFRFWKIEKPNYESELLLKKP